MQLNNHLMLIYLLIGLNFLKIGFDLYNHNSINVLKDEIELKFQKQQEDLTNLADLFDIEMTTLTKQLIAKINQNSNNKRP